RLYGRCICPAGYSGEKCTEVDQCYFSYADCKNYGTCVNARLGSREHVYKTKNEFVDDASAVYSACSSSPCAADSRCVDVANGVYDCSCKLGWQGDNCDE
ncbi:hypothetical protein PMAYCL1PPCAC_16227, partial [Pristionchus mayeri]